MKSRIQALRFPVGDIVVSQGATKTLSEDDFARGFIKHLVDHCVELSEPYDDEVRPRLEERRLVSFHFTKEGEPYWIMTTWDRTETKILLPEEYC